MAAATAFRKLRVGALPFALTLSCAVAAPGAARGIRPELTVQGGGASADADDGSSSDLRWAMLRLSWGADRLQLRGEISWLDFDGAALAAAPPGLGPVAPTRRGQGGSTGGQGASGSGAGSGATTGAIEAPASDPAPDDGGTRGLGDLRLGALVRVAGGGASQYRIDLGASAKLPTADEEKGLGTGELDWRLGVSGEYRFWSLTAFGGFGFNRLGDSPGLVLQDVVDAYVGAESLPLADRFFLSGWIEGSPELIAGEGSRVAACAGLRTAGPVRFELQATAGLTDAAEKFSISAGISFGLRPPTAGPSGARR